MSTGIHIEDSDHIYLGGNKITGFDKGVVLKNSANITAHNNIIIENAIQAYGSEFADVVERVNRDQSADTTKALEDILKNPHNADKSWVVLIKKYGTKIGRFTTGILGKVLTATAYAAIKAELKTHNIDI